MVISSLNQYIWCVLQSKCIYFIFYVYCIQAIVINVCDVYQEMLKQVWCISRQTWLWIMYLVLKQVWCISSKKSILQTSKSDKCLISSVNVCLKKNDESKSKQMPN